jgi:hypothetical protein
LSGRDGEDQPGGGGTMPSDIVDPPGLER